MQISGTSIIAAPVQTVWNALNEPEVLRRCLPGCESVERTSPEDFKILMTASVGPLRARFNGNLRMTDAQPPTHCVLQFEGQGGAMGFGKGRSTVSLLEIPEGTELTYTAEAQVGGKLAQVGSRLIDGVARKMSDDFFSAFRRQLAPQEAAGASSAANSLATPVAAPALEKSPAACVSASKSPVVPTSTDGLPSIGRPQDHVYTVPAWWLGAAVALGAIAAIAGGLLLH